MTWSAPEGCPSEARVVARVTENVGAATSPLRVRATATRSADGKWHVRVEEVRDGEHGERELEAESCDAAAEATALIVSLLIDPTWTPKTEAPKTPEVTRAAASVPSETTALAPAPEPPRSSPPRTGLPLVSARLSGAGDVGTLASAEGGGELAVAVTVKRFRFEVAASAWSAATATVPGD